MDILKIRYDRRMSRRNNDAKTWKEGWALNGQITRAETLTMKCEAAVAATTAATRTRKEGDGGGEETKNI